MTNRSSTTTRPSRLARAGRHLALVLVLAVALGALGVGCARGSESILSVNGWTLSRDVFLTQLDQIAKNPGYGAARRQNGQAFKVFKDGSTEEYTPEFVAEFLNERVTFHLAEAEVAKRKLTITDEDRRHATDTIVTGFNSGGAGQGAAVIPGAPGPGPGLTVPGSTVPGSTVPGSTVPGSTVPGSTVPGSSSGQAVLDAFGAYREVLVSGVANLQALQKALTRDISGDDQLRVLYEQVKDEFANQTCVRHILVRSGPGQIDPTTGYAIAGTEAEYSASLDKLIALKVRLDAGEDFAMVAKDTSEDEATKGNGGDLGCAPKRQYSGAFEAAVWSQPVGLVGVPVKSTFGYHLVLVTERRMRSFDEVKDKLRDGVNAQSQEAVQQWLATATQDAKVTVDAQFGHWNQSTGLIEAAGAGSTMTLVPGAGAGSLPPGIPSTSPPAVPRAGVGVAPTSATPPSGVAPSGPVSGPLGSAPK